MQRIKVTLLHHTPLYIASDGARTCWASHDKSDTPHETVSATGVNCPPTIGPKDLALLDRVGNQYHHSSVLEHISFNFFIDGISRACLQELCRHRMSSFSVKSSRFTLKELKAEVPVELGYDTSDNPSEEAFILRNKDEFEKAEKYLVMTKSLAVNLASINALRNLKECIDAGISNDEAKYCMPEAYRTKLTWTINLRSLQNFLSLRSSRKALPEIHHLAQLIYQSLPSDVQSLVHHCISGE